MLSAFKNQRILSRELELFVSTELTTSRSGVDSKDLFCMFLYVIIYLTKYCEVLVLWIHLAIKYFVFNKFLIVPILL